MLIAFLEVRPSAKKIIIKRKKLPIPLSLAPDSPIHLCCASCWQWRVMKCFSADIPKRQFTQSRICFCLNDTNAEIKRLINNLWTRLLHWSHRVLETCLKTHEEYSQRKLFAMLLKRPHPPGPSFIISISLSQAWQTAQCRNVATNNT